MPGRRTTRLRISNIAGSPLPSKSIPAPTAPTWARILPTPWLNIMGDTNTTSCSGGRTYSSRGSSARSFMCIADGAGTSVCYTSRPRTWLRTSRAHLDMVSTYTFWRFLIQIPLSDSEMKVQYSINDGLPMDFFVPGHHQTMRMAAYSVSDPNRHFPVLS
jgi:hypothetical protein